MLGTTELQCLGEIRGRVLAELILASADGGIFRELSWGKARK